MQEKDPLERFRGKTLKEVLSQVEVTMVERTTRALTTFEQSLQEVGPTDGTIFELGKRHLEGVSIRSLERQLNIGSNALGRMFTRLGIPIRTRAEASKLNNQDPDFRQRNSVASRANLEKLRQDPEFRRKSATATRAMLAEKWQDPEFRRMHSERLRSAWRDPEYKQRMSEEFLARRQDPEFERKRAEAVKANWQDPLFRERQAQATRVALRERWQDPHFRQRMAEDLRVKWGDPEFRRRQAEAINALWQDPQFRERNAEGVRVNWQDSEFRERNAAALRANWQDPEFRRRQAELSRMRLQEMNQDPEFRRRNAEAVRQARLNPANLGRYVLPTIYGERWDIGYAQSAWEANLARVIRFVGRSVLPHESLRLEDGSLFLLDFLTLDNRSRFVGYEIMAHPLENPEGWEKLERVILEYPNLIFRVVDERFYQRLRRVFAVRINSDPHFAGWEEGHDNLRDNPQKYA